MVIQHNMAAANANRMLGQVVTNQSKSTEKLSSGYRINRAADDAAGLSISEKMRGQIKGLDQASTNAQDGISLIQTAEGALNETHSILQRMRQLSVQAANGTETADDREAISKEIDQLQSEIDRISETTQFNTMNLLDGSFKTSFQIGANAQQTMDVEIGNMNCASLGLTSGAKLPTITNKTNADKVAKGQYTVDASNNLVDGVGNAIGTVNLSDGKVTLATGDEIELGHALTVGSTLTFNGTKDVDVTIKPANDNATSKLAPGNYTIKSGTTVMLGDKVVGKLDGADATPMKLNDGTAVDLADLGLVAADVADNGTFTIKGIDVSDSDKASNSTTTLDEAIKKVSSQRSSLGAVQNRLEHTIANLDTSAENLQTAESRIRDVDMAEEMVSFTKNNILQQAAQSMLAQANQSNQGVLSLLQ